MSDSNRVPRDIIFLDDATRPHAPPIPGVTPLQRQHGRQLEMIHRLHRQQLAEARMAMEMAEEGSGSVEAFRDAVARMDMIANFRRFATVCGRECQALTLHHKKEDYGLFPRLRTVSGGVARVIDRLMAEHKVIAGLVEELYSGAATLVEEPTPQRFAAARQSFTTLERIVVSHFGYEETELQEAIGVTSVPV